MKRIAGKVILVLAAMFSLVSGCKCIGIDPEDSKYDRVLILYSAGFNSLSDYLRGDLDELMTGYAPGPKEKRAFLIISHLPSVKGDYSVQTPPYLIRLYKDSKKGMVLDTLKSYAGNLSQPSTMKSILTDVKDQFPSEHFGMVFSSHATGWVPAGYYTSPSSYESGAGTSGKKSAAIFRDMPYGTFPYTEPELLPGEPLTKSFTLTNGSGTGTEMDLVDFKGSIPMHLDYMLMDACLAGGIEVAYELKDVCDRIGFSQAEILADGFNYKTLAGHLLESATVDTRAVVDDYYQQYAAKTDKTDRSATISLIDCTKLDALASVCKTLFSKYRTEIAGVDPYDVQRFYRNNKHWYYDLEDILVKAGISTEEQRSLTSALDGCIIYKAATEEFLKSYGGYAIKAFCGFSMYLPGDGTAFLDSYYKGLAWNKASGLVE